MKMGDFEKLVGIERNVPPAPTRRDIDRARRKKLSRPWKGMPARRKKQ
jgi:hypothetical protein